jgi:hypothetical protein
MLASLLALLDCFLGGCIEWTEGPQGQLTSIGVPGAAQPVWQSQANPPPIITPTDLGMSPEEAAKVSGPVLVLPPTATVKSWQYRYYSTGHNHCQDDLQKLLAARASNGESGDAPYCTDSPTAPPSKASLVIF